MTPQQFDAYLDEVFADWDTKTSRIVDFYEGQPPVHIGWANFDPEKGWSTDLILPAGTLERVEHLIFETGNDYGYVWKDNPTTGLQYVNRTKYIYPENCPLPESDR